MKNKLIIKDAVYNELEEAYIHYESKLPGLGLDFIDQWEDTIRYIEKHPEHFQKKTKHYRQALLKRFPYMVIYVITENTIVVYAVIQSKRHPSMRYKKH